MDPKSKRPSDEYIGVATTISTSTGSGEWRDMLMSDLSRKAHRESVYATKGENEVSSFQEYLAP